MAVYVDPVFEHGGSRTFPWTRSCHMYADSLEELHDMARRLGLKRAWFQPKDRLPHYDLVPGKRLTAIAMGAQQHTREQMVQFMRDTARRRGETLAGEQVSLFGGEA